MPSGTKSNADKPWLFQPGNPGGGRPKGSRNKLGEAFTDALYEDFQQHGVEAIQKVRAEDPSAYVRVIAGLLPKKVEITENPLESMNDDELARLIDLIRAADGASVSARNGDAKKGGSPLAH